jgi:hypothetical protein
MPYRNRKDSWALRRAKKVLAPLRKMLRTGDDHATFDRLFTSRHVCDLQLIAGITFRGVQVIVIVGFFVMLYYAFAPVLVKIATSGIGSLNLSLQGGLAFSSTLLTAFTPLTTVFAPVLAAFGAVLAWIYKVGSERLGVVDSFSCEIGALCRSALVVDTVGRNIDRFNRIPGARPAVSTVQERQTAPLFASQENYFPVFENGTKDLQVLEAKVVVNITAFYTFMKGVRDLTRSLAEMPNLPDHEGPESRDGGRAKAWQDRVRDLIYMMFLGLESARRALDTLVEYDPDHAELIVVVLISELRAYGFLCRQFAQANDIRYGQLSLRRAVYDEWVGKVCASVEAGSSGHKDWERAFRLLPELKRQYEDATGEKSTGAHA